LYKMKERKKKIAAGFLSLGAAIGLYKGGTTGAAIGGGIGVSVGTGVASMTTAGMGSKLEKIWII